MSEVTGKFFRTLDRPDGVISWGILAEDRVVLLRMGDRVMVDNCTAGRRGTVIHRLGLWYFLADRDKRLTILDIFDGCGVRLLEAAADSASVTDPNMDHPPLVLFGPGGDFREGWG